MPFQFNTTVFEYYNDEISYELSKYYEKYHWNQYIDPDYLSALTIDGNLYAVPTAINKYIKPRYYNEVTLNTLNLSVPNTINEFYDYLIKAKNLYSDDDTYYPMVIMNHRFASSVSDIARAFGVYFNDYFNSSVSFNPQTDSIEDAIFSEQITELISFIRQLQINGLLRTYGRYNRINPFSDELLDTYITNLDRVNKNFASEYNFVYSKSINGFIDYLFADKSYESINGYYLTGNNDKNVCEIHSDMGFYVFPRNIDNIDGVIDTFNSLFSNPDNYMDFKYGIIGEDYRIVNDNIVTINSSHSRSADLELKLISDPYKHDSSYVPESIQIIEKIDSYSAYERNVFNHMNTYSSVPLYNIFSFNKNEGLEAIFNPDIPIQDAIEYYKRLVIKSGRINTINELNKQLGKETQYDYNVN